MKKIAKNIHQNSWNDKLCQIEIYLLKIENQ